MKFKIGDKVKIVKNTSNHGFTIDDTVTITKTYPAYTATPHYRITGSNNDSSYCWDYEIELAWTPQNGELIEVCPKASTKWSKRIFIGMDKDFFICKHQFCDYSFIRWHYARQIKPTHIITIDNKNVEVNEENFQALKADILSIALTVTSRPK